MNLSTKVLIDTSRLKFELVNKTKFRTNSYFSSNEGNVKPKSKDIFVYEYDVFVKDEKNQKKASSQNKNSELNKKNSDKKSKIIQKRKKEIEELKKNKKKKKESIKQLDNDLEINIDEFID